MLRRWLTLDAQNRDLYAQEVTKKSLEKAIYDKSVQNHAKGK